MNDFKFACRQLFKNPGFTAVAVLTLALGIGANTTIFGVVDAVLLKPLRYDEPGQLVQVFEAPTPGARNSASPGAFLDWREGSTSFEGFSLFTFNHMNLTGTGEPERINGVEMSANGLQLLRARPILGRIFSAEEDQPGKEKVVVLTHKLWQRRFGSDTNIVGSTISLSDEKYSVLGVLPPQFLPWEEPEIVVPSSIGAGNTNQRSAHWLEVLGRLKPGITVAQAQDEMSALCLRLKSLYPTFKKSWGVTIVPLQEHLTGRFKPLLMMLLAAVSCVLMIGCANVANLLLAKSSSRQKEIAIRSALGASRWRVVRQLLVESLVLSLAGAVLGLLIAFWATNAIKSLAPLPRLQEVGLDLRTLSFTLSISLLTGLVFGLAPSWQMSRSNTSDALKDGVRTTSNISHNHFRNVLIVGEVALALVLLAGAGLLVNSFYRLSHVASGINPHNVLAVDFSLPDKKYPNAERRAAFYEQLTSRIYQLPGVESVGISGTLPMGGWPGTTSFTVIGRGGQPDAGNLTEFDFCSPDFFKAAGIPLLKGRAFNMQDRTNAPKVAIISEAFVREYFPNENPLGKRVHLEVFTGKLDDGWEIVGIVGDVRQRGLTEQLHPCIYRPLAFGIFSGEHLFIKAANPLAITGGIRQAIKEVDPAQPISNVRTLESVLAASVGERRFTLILLNGFAATAMLLASIGLYGVIAYAVSQRTREIGIRVALGATRRNVLALILNQGMKMACAGILFGITGALCLARLMTRFLFDVKATDPITLIGVSLILWGVAFVACWIPARRAAKVDPMVALRTE